MGERQNRALKGVSAKHSPSTNEKRTRKLKGKSMLYTIAVILLVLWLLGLVSSYTLGGFIHILLVIAVVMVLVSLFSGRRRV
jgi:hypothetical protein